MLHQGGRARDRKEEGPVDLIATEFEDLCISASFVNRLEPMCVTRHSSLHVLTCASLVWGVSFAFAADPPPAPHAPLLSPLIAVNVSAYELLSTDAPSGSTLWRTASTHTWSLGAPLLLDLHGTRVQQGAAYAALVGAPARAHIASLFDTLVPNATEQVLLRAFLDWQWRAILAPYVPAEYLAEAEGMASVSSPLWDGVRQLLALAVGPADGDNWQRVIADELATGEPCPFSSAQLAAIVDILSHLGGRATPRCDMFAVWGPRTVGGSVLASRNLDWVVDSGVSRAKLITVYHPPEAGRSAYATVGFAGFVGAIAGMSARGVSVTQSNLDNSLVTMRGVIWPFRMRHILETATTVADVRAVYTSGPLSATAGTANHVVSAQADAVEGRTAAVAAECIAPENALYTDNDPREANATYRGARIGFPLPHALWRSNHALAASMLPTQVPLWDDTLSRYMMQRTFILDAEAAGARIDEVLAVRMVATMGQKGEDYYTCTPGAGGENVISAVYAPAAQRIYAAWEDGSSAGWTPAACTAYQRFDLAGWFARE